MSARMGARGRERRHLRPRVEGPRLEGDPSPAIPISWSEMMATQSRPRFASWGAMRSTTRSPRAAWRRSTSGACSARSASRARSRSSGCIRSSRRTPSSSRCSSTRRASRRASGTRTSSRRSTSSRPTASSSSSWSTSTASRSRAPPHACASRTSACRRGSPRRSCAASSTAFTPRTRRRTSAASRSTSSIATSPRRTSSSAPTASRACSTSASRRPQGRIQARATGRSRASSRTCRRSSSPGATLTRAVDIYAAAVVLWETLTAERLFKGETEAETLAKILARPGHAAERGPAFPAESVRRAAPPGALARADAAPRDGEGARARARALRRDREPDRGRRVGRADRRPVLNARETQIAEIECELRVPARRAVGRAASLPRGKRFGHERHPARDARSRFPRPAERDAAAAHADAEQGITPFGPGRSRRPTLNAGTAQHDAAVDARPWCCPSTGSCPSSRRRGRALAPLPITTSRYDRDPGRRHRSHRRVHHRARVAHLVRAAFVTKAAPSTSASVAESRPTRRRPARAARRPDESARRPRLAAPLSPSRPPRRRARIPGTAANQRVGRPRPTAARHGGEADRERRAERPGATQELRSALHDRREWQTSNTSSSACDCT